VELAEYPDYDYVPCAEREEEVRHNKAQLGDPWNYDLLSGITYLTGTLDVQSDSTGDKDFTKLTGLRCIDGDMRIWYTDELESLHGLESLIRIGGNLDIEANKALSDISALSGITGTKGKVDLYGCPLMESLEGLHNIEKAQTISIETMNALKDLNGIRGLQSVGTLVIYTATQLNTLAGLENVNKIGCVLQIVNTNISSLQGLSGLESMGTDCEDAVIILGNNHNLSSLEGMDNLETITGTFQLISNSILADTRGLEKITGINGDIIIDNNDSLKALTGLENLKTITESIRITGNLNLMDITALYNLESFGSDLGRDLVIINNPKLPTCQCEHLRSLLMAKGWNGFYDFTGTDGTASCE